MSGDAQLPLRPLTWITAAEGQDPFGPVEVAYAPLEADVGLGFEAVERAAAGRLAKIAVDDGELALSYAELLDRAYGLAARIAATTDPGGCVASVLPNGAGATCALLAAFGAGRTFVPVDAAHPAERRAAILAESGATAVILHAGASADEAPPGAQILWFDPAAPTSAPRYSEPGAERRARFVGFTSGSTGRPKGLAHGGSRSAVAGFIDRLHINSEDVFASLASLSQTGAADLIALAVGASLRVVDIRKTGLSAGLKALRDAGITVLSFVPSALRALMSVPGAEATFASLRVLDLHGERVLTSDLQFFREKLPERCRICVTYGTTETGVVFSWFPDIAALSGPVAPVGRLTIGKEAALVGEDGASVAPGEVGELLVRGDIALGSWQGGRLTPARFLEDAERPGGRIYVTGDLFRQTSEGLFEFVGRKDRKVKIRGLWADLGEVETALRGSDDVDDAVVWTQDRDGQVESLRAAVTPVDPARSLDIPALRRRVAEACAEHMVPARIDVVAQIPRLPNHKPDLKALARS